MNRSLRLVSHGCARSVAALAFGLPGLAAAATYSVGNDPASCDFAEVQLAVNAAETNPGGDTIRVAAGSYTAQAIVIDSQTLTIEGGYASCTAASPTATSTLDGAGGSADSVLAVTGLNNIVHLRRLQIIGGDETDDANGGGLQLAGGQVTLSDVEIANNRAGYGGGIYASDVSLILGSNVRVIGNTAHHSGGGIRLSGASLRADADAIYIGFNDAGSGNGGGIAVRSSVADLGSPGFGTLPMLHANEAAYGAAIATVLFVIMALYIAFFLWRMLRQERR